MAESFARYWPSTVQLSVYAEGFELPAIAPNIRAAAFAPWFDKWKRRHAMTADAHGLDLRRNRRERPYDFRRDCVRFAHKVAAITDAAFHASLDVDLLVLMDADTLAHAQVSEEWLRGLIFGGKRDRTAYAAWLDRRGTYPECGFVLFNALHLRHHEFMLKFRDLYASDDVFRLAETHDSYVLQQLMGNAVAAGVFPEPVSLSGSARSSRHPFPLSELGSRLDHMKGPRKSLGRTPKTEVAGRRTEPHWR
jgi:hypothetical protein